MIYPNAKLMADGMRSMGHEPVLKPVGTGRIVVRYVCSNCGKSGFHRNDGGHAYGNAIGNKCGTEPEIPVIPEKNHKALKAGTKKK